MAGKYAASLYSLFVCSFYENIPLHIGVIFYRLRVNLFCFIYLFISYAGIALSRLQIHITAMWRCRPSQLKRSFAAPTWPRV